MTCPWSKKIVKSGSTWARLCVTHISETDGWIYTIWSSMELSRLVVVKHRGHLTLTLEFQSQFLKMLYLRNGRADWHGTKCMWVDRMLDPHCDFELWPHPWLWSMTLTPDWHGAKGMWVDWMLDPCCDFQLWPQPWPSPWIFNVKVWNSCIPWMGGPIDLERKVYESIGRYSYFVTLSYDIDLGFSR